MSRGHSCCAVSMACGADVVVAKAEADLMNGREFRAQNLVERFCHVRLERYCRRSKMLVAFDCVTASERSLAAAGEPVAVVDAAVVAGGVDAEAEAAAYVDSGPDQRLQRMVHSGSGEAKDRLPYQQTQSCERSSPASRVMVFQRRSSLPTTI